MINTINKKKEAIIVEIEKLQDKLLKVEVLLELAMEMELEKEVKTPVVEDKVKIDLAGVNFKLRRIKLGLRTSDVGVVASSTVSELETGKYASPKTITKVHNHYLELEKSIQNGTI